MKIIYMGTSSFAVPPLKALVEKGVEIAFVVTQPDRIRGRGKAIIPTPVKQYADSVGLRVEQPETIRDNLDFIQALRDTAPDLIIVASYGKILPREILEIPEFGCINIHASLLPKYRGAAPIQWVIADGEKETGVCLLRMGEGLDSGDVGACSSIEIGDMNAGELEEKLSEMGARLLLENLGDLECGSMMWVPQEDTLATYARMLTKEDAHIDLCRPAKDVLNKINAMNPVPGSYVCQEDSRIKIKRAEIKELSAEACLDDNYAKAEEGTILDVTKDGIEVKLSDGILLIKEIGMPGKKPMSVGDYIKGNKIDTTIPLS